MLDKYKILRFVGKNNSYNVELIEVNQYTNRIEPIEGDDLSLIALVEDDSSSVKELLKKPLKFLTLELFNFWLAEDVYNTGYINPKYFDMCLTGIKDKDLYRVFDQLGNPITIGLTNRIDIHYIGMFIRSLVIDIYAIDEDELLYIGFIKYNNFKYDGYEFLHTIRSLPTDPKDLDLYTYPLIGIGYKSNHILVHNNFYLGYIDYKNMCKLEQFLDLRDRPKNGQSVGIVNYGKCNSISDIEVHFNPIHNRIVFIDGEFRLRNPINYILYNPNPISINDLVLNEEELKAWVKMIDEEFIKNYHNIK